MIEGEHSDRTESASERSAQIRGQLRQFTTPRHRVTLKDISEKAGVSPSTVSRVLNAPDGPNTRWAARATAENIWELATSLGYARNPHAASLRTARSGLIGVVVPRLQDYVLATMYEGVDAAAAEHGVFSVVTNSRDEPDVRKLRAQQLLDRRVDGLIFGDARLDDPLLQTLTEQNVPFTLMSRRSGDYPSVTCDDFYGGYLMGEHFARQGYESLAIIAGSMEVSTSVDREAGFREALAAHGIDSAGIPVYVEGFDATSGGRAMRRILNGEHRPRAVFAVNDFSAIGALGALREAGLRVPEDVALAGFNDTPLAAGVNLTTVRSPMFDIGFEAMKLLVQLTDGAIVEPVRIRPELVIRGSA